MWCPWIPDPGAASPTTAATLITTLTMYVPERAVSVVGDAELDEANPDNDFSGAGLIRFPGNVRGYVRAYDNGPNESSHDIVGTGGMVRIINDARSIQIWTASEASESDRQLRERYSFVRSHFPPPVRRHSGGVNAVYDLIHCIESGDDPRCSGEDAREALEIAIAIRESERRGNQPVDLPLADRSARIVSGEVVRSELPRAILRQREESAQT